MKNTCSIRLCSAPGRCRCKKRTRGWRNQAETAAAKGDRNQQSAHSWALGKQQRADFLGKNPGLHAEGGERRQGQHELDQTRTRNIRRPLNHFIARILDARPRRASPNSFLRYTAGIRAQDRACSGLSTRFSQTLIKLTLPGVPDTYQGQELFDSAWSDPDNRRPVDFARRQPPSERDHRAHARGAGDQWFVPGVAVSNGRTAGLKLWVTYRGLHARREYQQAIRTGRLRSHRKCTGSGERHVVAYARTLWPADGRRSDSEICVRADERRRAHASGRPVGNDANRAAAAVTRDAIEKLADRRNPACRAANFVMPRSVRQFRSACCSTEGDGSRSETSAMAASFSASCGVRLTGGSANPNSRASGSECSCAPPSRGRARLAAV